MEYELLVPIGIITLFFTFFGVCMIEAWTDWMSFWYFEFSNPIMILLQAVALLGLLMWAFGYIATHEFGRK